MMNIEYGRGTTKYGPGVSIQLTDDEVALAIDSWLIANRVRVVGPRTVTMTMDGDTCEGANVYVDPSGYVIDRAKKISGRGR